MGMFGPFVETTTYKADGKLDYNAMLQKTKECIEEKVPVICEAALMFYGNYCALDILRKNEIDDVESAAMAIEHGYVVKREEKLFVTAPAFTKSQYAEFKNLAEQAFEPSVKIYAQAVTDFLNDYRKLFPKHLEKEVTMACRYMFLSLFAVICQMAQEKGMLKSPGKGSICDVLLQNNSVFAV